MVALTKVLRCPAEAVMAAAIAGCGGGGDSGTAATATADPSRSQALATTSAATPGVVRLASYQIEVIITGNFTNHQQLPGEASPGDSQYEAAHAWVTVMIPTQNNSIVGSGFYAADSHAAELDRRQSRPRVCQPSGCQSLAPNPTPARHQWSPCAKRARRAESPARAQVSAVMRPCAFRCTYRDGYYRRRHPRPATPESGAPTSQLRGPGPIRVSNSTTDNARR